MALGLALLLSLPACSLRPVAPASEGIVHLVLIWLKEPGNAAHRRQLIEGTRVLAEIPGVEALRVGPPLPSERAVAESSYDVGIAMHFATVEALQAYLQHPLHQQQLRELYRPLMARFRVVDIDAR